MYSNTVTMLKQLKVFTYIQDKWDQIEISIL